MHEGFVRLGFFAGVLSVMALWELSAPLRKSRISKGRRWLGNFAILILNSIIVRVLFPTAALGVAMFAGSEGWGVFNYFSLPPWISVVLCIVALDVTIYYQHVLLHAVPVLWRVHRMHHADQDFDVSTGGRFHPLEILLSMLIKFAAIVILGAPALAVVIFEVVLSATSLFNHSNVRIATRVDRMLRLLLVTPDMHRVHHSIEPDETDSNFGFNLPWWDRLFGTYRAQPRAGHENMEIGQRSFRDVKQCQDLLGMLAIPFVAGESPLAERAEQSDANKERS
jgi:sterol desaturase/sphingolipid hydroxylase (fatty acid hydroxylase superfamily)